MGPLSSQALGQLPSVPMTEDGTAQTPDYCNISCEHSTINNNKKIDTQQVGRQNNMNKETNNSRQNTTPLHEPTLSRGWTREAYDPPPLVTPIMILWKRQEHLMIWNSYWPSLKHRLTHKCKNKYSHFWQTKTIQENRVIAKKNKKKTKTPRKPQTFHNRDRQSNYGEIKNTIKFKMSDLQTTSIDKIGLSCSCKNSVIYDDVVQM